MKTFGMAISKVSTGILALFLVGCVHKTIHLEVLDGGTGKPLPDVTAEWREHRYQMLQTIVHSEAIKMGPSDRNGSIVIGGAHRNWVSTFVFRKPGYSDLYGRYEGGSLKLGTSVSPGLYETDFQVEGRSQSIKSNKVFLVPMFR
jgi:hypothetical protein